MKVEIKNCITVLRGIPDKSVDFIFVNIMYAPDFFSDPKWNETRKEFERVKKERRK